MRHVKVAGMHRVGCDLRSTHYALAGCVLRLRYKQQLLPPTLVQRHPSGLHVPEHPEPPLQQSRHACHMAAEMGRLLE
jgi:hypothetical protein